MEVEVLRLVMLEKLYIDRQWFECVFPVGFPLRSEAGDIQFRWLLLIHRNDTIVSDQRAKPLLERFAIPHKLWLQGRA